MAGIRHALQLIQSRNERGVHVKTVPDNVPLLRRKMLLEDSILFNETSSPRRA